MWRLHWASPLQISPVGVCPLQRPPYPGDYPQLRKAYLASGGSYRLGSLQKDTLRHSWCRVQGVQPNGLRHCSRWCCTLLRWHRLSISHHLVGRQRCSSRQYSRQASPPGGESLSTPPSIKLPPLVVKAQRTVGERGLEGGETVADLPVTPGECKRRQIGRCLVRRVISPLGQHQTFPQPQHLKVHRLSWAVGQGVCPMIPHDWPPNTVARDGRRTLSMCSRSTTSIMPPPIRRQSG